MMTLLLDIFPGLKYLTLQVGVSAENLVFITGNTIVSGVQSEYYLRLRKKL
jgi:hypothetical protein